MTTYTNRYSHHNINTLRGRAHTKKLETATRTLHPRKFALTVLNAWTCTETSELTEG
jgi:hypothetical protein